MRRYFVHTMISDPRTLKMMKDAYDEEHTEKTDKLFEMQYQFDDEKAFWAWYWEEEEKLPDFESWLEDAVENSFCFAEISKDEYEDLLRYDVDQRDRLYGMTPDCFACYTDTELLEDYVYMATYAGRSDLAQAAQARLLSIKEC